MLINQTYICLLTFIFLQNIFGFQMISINLQRKYNLPINKFVLKSSMTYSKSPFLNPLKVFLFIDGTWLYYSLLRGRGDQCPIRKKFGASWQSAYKVDWNKLPQIISRNLGEQLTNQLGYSRQVEVMRSCVFTSVRSDTSEDALRAKMIQDLKTSNFEVHCLTSGDNYTGPEKCVDISLACEMLYLATVPETYDIAVILTGDKDFIPALQKTRMKAKRVAICSMQNSCNRDLIKPENHVRDFDVIWLENYMDVLIQSKFSEHHKMEKDQTDAYAREVISDVVRSSPRGISSRDLGRHLSKVFLPNDPDVPLLTHIKTYYSQLIQFLPTCSEITYSFDSNSSTGDFLIYSKYPPVDYPVHSVDSTIDFDTPSKNTLEDIDDMDIDNNKISSSYREETSNNNYLEKTNLNYKQIELMTVPMLKSELRKRKLAIGGKKTDLIDRLFEYENR